MPVGRGVALAGTWRTAAGRPHTPIVAGIAAGVGFAPVFGAINSERLPRYERLDLAVNWLVPAGAGVVVFFASLDNVLARVNFFDYRYSPDYSSRQPRRPHVATVDLRRRDVQEVISHADQCSCF